MAGLAGEVKTETAHIHSSSKGMALKRRRKVTASVELVAESG